MKTKRLLLTSTLVAAALVASSGMATAQSELLTFDDLVPGNLPGADTTYEGPIPNGYNGLQWNNFWVKDTLTSPSPSGYQYGLVSANNVAFNGAGSPAMISDQSFNLNSAYLTAAWNDGLQVEVQGFVGATLTHDNTYTVNTTGPTLINFNYLGVDEVNFISSGGTPHAGLAGFGRGEHFVIDNLSITVIPEPGTLTLAGFGLAGMTLIARRRYSK